MDIKINNYGPVAVEAKPAFYVTDKHCGRCGRLMILPEENRAYQCILTPRPYCGYCDIGYTTTTTR